MYVFSVVHEALNHTRLMNSDTIKEIAPKHVTSIMISGAFPSYRDASLFSAVMLGRFKTFWYTPCTSLSKSA